jgi:hypothetical protein
VGCNFSSDVTPLFNSVSSSHSPICYKYYSCNVSSSQAKSRWTMPPDTLATRFSSILRWKTFQADSQSLGKWSEFHPPSSLHNPGSAQLNSQENFIQSSSPSFSPFQQYHSRPFFDIWQWTKSSHKASEYPKHQTVLRFHWFIPKASTILVFAYLF